MFVRELHHLLKLSRRVKYSFLSITLSFSDNPILSASFQKADGLYPCFFNEAIVGSLLSSHPEYFPASISCLILVAERSMSLNLTLPKKLVQGNFFPQPK